MPSSSGGGSSCIGAGANEYKDRSWPSVMVRTYGYPYATAPKVPLLLAGCLYASTNTFPTTFSFQVPHPPSSNPTAIPKPPLSCSSTARQVGTSPSNNVFLAISPFPFKSQALNPSSLSAVTTTPSASLTNILGVDLPSLTLISWTSQAPILQLCLNLYCLFQFVFSPSFLSKRLLSSNHLLLRLEKWRSSFRDKWRTPGMRNALGSTKRL